MSEKWKGVHDDDRNAFIPTPEEIEAQKAAFKEAHFAFMRGQQDDIQLNRQGRVRRQFRPENCTRKAK